MANPAAGVGYIIGSVTPALVLGLDAHRPEKVADATLHSSSATTVKIVQPTNLVRRFFWVVVVAPLIPTRFRRLCNPEPFILRYLQTLLVLLLTILRHLVVNDGVRRRKVPSFLEAVRTLLTVRVHHALIYS
jgi:hypothetical protein